MNATHILDEAKNYSNGYTDGKTTEIQNTITTVQSNIADLNLKVLKPLNSTNKTFTNLMSTNLDGVYPQSASGYATTDQGATEAICPISTDQWPGQRFRIKVTTNNKYLFVVKTRVIAGAGSLSLLARYGNTATNLSVSGIAYSTLRNKTYTGEDEYRTYAITCTPDNASYTTVDFTLAWDSANKNINWAYKEAMAFDITNMSADDICAIMTGAYFQTTATRIVFSSKFVDADIDKKITKTYTNLVSTSQLVGLYPVDCTIPSTDQGATEVIVPVSTSQWPTYRIRIKTVPNHRYLFKIKLSVTAGTGTVMMLSRYGNVTDAVSNNNVPTTLVSSVISSKTVTAAFGYIQFTQILTHGNAAFENIDFSLAFDSANKDIAWKFKEVSVIDVSNCTSVEITDLINAPYFQTTYSKEIPITNPHKNERLLMIGDSLTASNGFQSTVSALLGGATITNHAYGGIGFVAAVDGNGSDFAALTVGEVRYQDVIVVWLGMNSRDIAPGVVGDLHPTQSTIIGQMQYVIDKIYTLLKTCGNLQCKILFVTPHCCGKYDYVDADGYTEYPASSGRTLKTLCDAMVSCANANNIPVLNLYNDSGIGKNTWSIYCASPYATVTAPIGSTAPYPTNGDQVHLNLTTGYPHVGKLMASRIKYNFA